MPGAALNTCGPPNAGWLLGVGIGAGDGNGDGDGSDDNGRGSSEDAKGSKLDS